MANIKTFSSVSVRDYTDLGQILLYCTSSQPTTVAYNPNTGVYLPNWGEQNSHLVITPVIQYNGSTLALNAQGLTVTFTKKEGTDSASSLGTGESVSGGVLTVSANKFSSSIQMITYICHVSYTDPEVGVPISTESSLTYTLMSQATELKSAYITGQSLFSYDTNGSLVGSDTITLSADVQHVAVQQWQYQQANNTFAAFPNTYNAQINGTTLIVKATEPNIWLNGKTAIIKLVTTDANVYDIHQITKISDGAPGNATLSAVLSNENHYVPCDANGTVLSWNGATSTITIYEGGTNVTDELDANNQPVWTITASPGSGLNGSYNSSTHTFTPSALSSDTSYCDFVCSKTDPETNITTTLTKRYTITKSRSGADGEDAVVYTLDCSSLTINKNQSGSFSPVSITFSSWKRVGNAVSATAYPGRFVIEESTNGSTYPAQAADSSNQDETTRTWSPSSGNVKLIKCSLYAAGGTTTLLDSQTIVITQDGQDGENGAAGVNGISMGLGNYQDIIPCKSDGTTAQAKYISIPFYAYSGIQRIPVTASVTTLPTGMSVVSSGANAGHAGDTTQDGLLVIAVENNSALGNASRLTGDITITLSCSYNSQTQSMNQIYTYTKNLQATDGQNATIMQIYSEDGGIIRNSTGTTTLKIRLVSGASEVSPTAVKWYKWVSTPTPGYSQIVGQTSTSLTVTADMVDDLAFFKATASYGGVTDGYAAFYTVDDLQDPYMSYTFATVQEFKNSQGFGAVYTRVYQNGVEVDPIKSTTFSDTAPTVASSGDYYYHLDTTNKKCILKKYNGSSWSNVTTGGSDDDELAYAYYRNDSTGSPVAADNGHAYTQQSNQDRCLYIDPSIINGAMQFICEVSNRSS